MSQPNLHHVLMGLYKPELIPCQLWEFELKPCSIWASKPEAIMVEHIFAAIYDEYRLTNDDLKVITRKREIVKVRQIVSYLLRKHTKLSLKQIGEMLGGQDHTTIMNSVTAVENLIATDKDYCTNLIQLETKIKMML